MKAWVACAVLVAVSGCVGTEGKQGPQGFSGPTGPRGEPGAPGEGFEAMPAIASVTPGFVVPGQTLDVAITGAYTTWTNGALVAFGEGITVNTTSSPSPVALLVNITVAPNAAVGTRDITVTQNGKATVWKAAFKVNPLYKAEVLGKPGRGALALVRLTSYDPDLTFDTSWSGTTYLGVRATSSPASNIIVQEVTAKRVDLLVTGDLDSPLGMRDLRVINQFGRPSEKSFVFPQLFDFVDVVETSVDGGSVTGMLPPFGSAYFKYQGSSSFEQMASVTSTGGAGAAVGHPMIAMMGSTGKFTGTALPLTNSFTFTPYSTPYHFVVFDPSGAAGFNYTFSLLQLTRTLEMEPNDAKETASALTPPALLSATFTSGTDLDQFKVTVTDGELGRHLRVRTRYGTTGHYSTDSKVEVYTPSGALFASSPDTTYHEELRTPALDATGEWVIKISYGTYYPPWSTYKANYELLVNWE